MSNSTEVNGKWVVSKPLIMATLFGRLKDCYQILRNKAIAVKFHEDLKTKGSE